MFAGAAVFHVKLADANRSVPDSHKSDDLSWSVYASSMMVLKILAISRKLFILS
jgi:hypothetical protein